MQVPDLTRGPSWLQKWASQIKAAIDAHKPVAGSGVSTNESGNGIAISVGKGTQSSDSGGDDGGEGGDTATYYVVIDGVLYQQNFLVDGDPVAV